jgi:hypothetical protein
LEELRDQLSHRSQFVMPLGLDPPQVCVQWLICDRVDLGLDPILDVLIVNKDRDTNQRFLLTK